MGIFGTIAGTAGNFMESRANRKDARQAKKDNMEFAKTLDWEPMYASDVAPTFKRTESPVARSYIESFLMGNNPDSTFKGSINSGETRAAQQAAQNAMYGTPEARVARQRQIEQETPWKVTAPTREVGQKRSKGSSAAGDKGYDKDEPVFQGMNPRAKEAGVRNQAMYDDLVKHGVLKPGQDFSANAIQSDGSASAVQQMLAKDRRGSSARTGGRLRRDQGGAWPTRHRPSRRSAGNRAAQMNARAIEAATKRLHKYATRRRVDLGRAKNPLQAGSHTRRRPRSARRAAARRGRSVFYR